MARLEVGIEWAHREDKKFFFFGGNLAAADPIFLMGWRGHAFFKWGGDTLGKIKIEKLFFCLIFVLLFLINI